MTSMKRIALIVLCLAVFIGQGRAANPCDSNSCQSKDLVCKPITDTDYKCVCVDCDDSPVVAELGDLAPSACIPNPCQGDCQCFESCQHAGGYYCRSESGFLGKNCSIPVPILRCEPDKMVLSVSESFVEEYDMGLKNSFVFVSPSTHQHSSMCEISVATNGVYEIEIPPPFNACNTTAEETDEGIVFSNQMWLNRRVSNAMFDMPLSAVKFQCSYNRVYKVVTSMKPVVGTPTVVARRKDVYPSISLCKVSDCPASCPELYQVSGGAFYTVGEMIHVTMSLDSGAKTTGVVNMFLSCSSEPTSPGMVDIVDDGCTSGSGLPSFVRSTFVSETVCVSFQTPRALRCNEFFIHAELQSCERSDTEKCPASGNLRCLSKRAKRSIPSVVVLGPLIIVNGSAGQPMININGMDEIEGDGFTRNDAVELLDLQEQKELASGVFDTFLVIGLCLTAALLVFILVPFAYVRSTRKL